MNANVSKTNNGKRLLAAVVAMAMIICAVAMISTPAEADAPTADFSGVTATPITKVADFGAVDGVVTINEATVYDIQTTIGGEGEPVDLSFILKESVQFTSSNGSKIYIQNSNANATFMFKAEGKVLEFSGIEASVDSNVANSSVFNMNANDVNGKISVVDGATLNVTQTQGKSTWMGPKTIASKYQYLTVTGTEDQKSTVNFNKTNTLQDVVLDADWAIININNAKFTGITLNNGSALDNSTITVNGAGDSGVQLKGATTLVKSTITVTGAGSERAAYPGINFYNAANANTKLTLDKDSVVNGQSFGFNDAWNHHGTTDSSNSVVIEGAGKVIGTFNAPVAFTTESATSVTAAYAFNGVTVEGAVNGYVSGNIVVDSVGATVKADVSASQTFTIKSAADQSSIAFVAGAELNVDVSSGSIKVNGEIVLPDQTGMITITGNAVVDGDTKIDGTITMGDGAKLTVPEGTNLTADKITGSGSTKPVVDLQGDLVITDENAGNVSGVDILLSSGATYTGVKQAQGDSIKYNSQGGQFQFGETLNSNYTVTTDEYLSTELTIPSGVTLTIGSNGSLNMAGHNINLYGTIVVQGNGTISGTKGTEQINLMRGAELQNEGIIGYGQSVVVAAGTPTATGGNTPAYAGTGTVTMANVSGLSFGLANTTADNATQGSYTLTVTGDIQAEGVYNSYSVTIKDARIVDELYIGQDVTVTIAGATSLMGSAGITVDGTLNAAGALTMKNGSTITVNGNLVGQVKAEAGDYEAGESYTTGQTTFQATATANDNIDAYINGYVLSVGTSNYQDKDQNGNDVTMVAQRLYINGTAVFNTDSTETITKYIGTFTFIGTAPVVAAEQSLVLPDGLKVTSANAIDVQGTIQYTTTNVSNVPVDKFTGAYYTVTVTTPSRTITGYIMPFESAMENIAGADRQTVYVYGAVEIENDITLAAGQTLNIRNGNAVITIGEDAEFIVEPRATVTGTIQTVDGMLTVKNNGSCGQPAEFAVKSSGTDAAGVQYTRYSGIVAAINNANPGDTIEVVNAITDIENLTIPAGVTVKATAGITFSGNLIIEETATLEMTDNAALTATGAKSKITVNGTLDASEGSVAFQNATRDNAITSSGSTVLKNANYTTLYEGDAVINAVAYKNEDACTVLTSAAAAVQAAAAQDVNKSVTVLGAVSAGDIELAVDMIVDADANASFGTISVSDRNTVKVDGKLTATISVQTGAEGSTSASTMELENAEDILVGAGSYNDNGVTNYVMYIYNNAALKGDVTIASGTAVVGYGTNSTLTVNGADTSLTIASGATLVVDDGMTLNIGTTGTEANKQPAVVVEGTLDVNEGATVAVGYNPGTAVDGNILVSGTLDVGDNVEIVIASGSQMTVTGTLAVSTTQDEAGKVTVNGLLVVGEKPTMVGATGTGVVTGAIDTPASEVTGMNGAVKVYAGGDVSGALIDVTNGESQAKSTVFHINGGVYMTVYTENNNLAIQTVVSGETFDITGLVMNDAENNPQDDTRWFQTADLTGTADDKNVGAEGFENVYFQAAADQKQVVISYGTGISLYVDGIKINSDNQWLTVGEHTVTATVDPGYTGTVTVTFNGQTVTDGTFTITPEMTSPSYTDKVVLSATGDISVAGGSSSGTTSGSNDGMGLTDYLLIILVVLIVIMAIMVAMRLMRS